MDEDSGKRPGADGEADGGDEGSPGEERGAFASVFVEELVGALRDLHGTPEGLALQGYRDSLSAERREAVERYTTQNLASLAEVMRARWQAAFEAKVKEWLRTGADLQHAERLAREPASLDTGKALRGLASDVMRGQLPAFLLVGASEAVHLQGAAVGVALPGFPLQVTAASRPELWGWFARCAVGESGLGRDGLPCDGESARWLAAVRVRADWPGDEAAQRAAWPWGEYSTPKLELMAEAVREFWSGWDGETASAPKNDSVVAWLEARGMTNNLAGAVATLIRWPQVPSGARSRRTE